MILATMKYLLDNEVLDGDCLTVTGNTLGKNLENISTKVLSTTKNKIFNYNKPLKIDSHIRIFKGNISPKGSVGKITGKEGVKFVGRSLVFDNEESFVELVVGKKNNEVNSILKDKVVVIRNQGPRGSPGMPEMLKATSLINGLGLSNNIAFITDGRFSGGSHGFLIGHITPESYDGGVISIIKNGDIIEIDAIKNTINLKIKSKTIKNRLRTNKSHNNNNNKFNKDIFLEKYKKLVGTASDGCLTH